MFWNKERFIAVIPLVLLAFTLCGCAGVETGQNQVVTDYLLTKAGFAKLEVTSIDAERKALMTAIPSGEFSAYHVDGKKYYVYKDEPARALYFGDEAAYQKFTSLVSDKRLCQSMAGSESTAFWSCFQEFQKAGGK